MMYSIEDFQCLSHVDKIGRVVEIQESPSELGSLRNLIEEVH